ncbi:cell envelope integrity protein TolA [Xylella fastidiosa]|uniref:cell envelope integrity protein TolA n=1 Tax=Xylella fastidiosa TaxID=2371 RepID=UPI0003D2F2E5|nr:cell envelope integrity protein TolA [Xylella fastidiosa]ALR04090.1 cell envelope integrity protein TolA [Xylella fastidiosa]KXB20364.1 protein TolA [Xylella fastidiosa]OJZ71586.1 protein TolA [Xylella fastidiosa 6c]
MHADSRLGRSRRREGVVLPALMALLLHAFIGGVFLLAWLWSPQHKVSSSDADSSIEASLDVSVNDTRIARQALRNLPVQAPVSMQLPLQDTTPPQPIFASQPQNALTSPQTEAQERIESQEMAKREQEAKHRQEQIDLTEERKRQQQAEQKLRLARQQEEIMRKQVEEHAQIDRLKKLTELRKRREQLETQIQSDAKQADLAEQKLRQLAAERSQQSSPSPVSNTNGGQGSGKNVDNKGLLDKYKAAIQQAVSGQWSRPPSVPLGQECMIHITQLPGGRVLSAEVAPDCPYDDAGRRSIESAVMRAQPLPYRGFEPVFERDVYFKFIPEDH